MEAPSFPSYDECAKQAAATCCRVWHVSPWRTVRPPVSGPLAALETLALAPKVSSSPMMLLLPMMDLVIWELSMLQPEPMMAFLMVHPSSWDGGRLAGLHGGGRQS